MDVSGLLTHIGKLREDEYTDKQGKPYCKACKTPRFFEDQDDKGNISYYRTMCDCQREEIKKRDEAIARANRINEFHRSQRLSALGVKYYNARFENSEITDSNKAAYEKCKKYIESVSEVYKNNIGMYIYGDNSSGKTHLTACMCNALVEKGYSCKYTSVPMMLAEIQRSYNHDGLGQAQLVDILSRQHFVFIDDLGKEFLGREYNPSASKFAEKVLLEVLNARYNNGRPTIFSSNYSIAELADIFKLDKAIIERINEMSTRVIKLEGDDFREQKLKEKSELAKRLGI